MNLGSKGISGKVLLYFTLHTNSDLKKIKTLIQNKVEKKPVTNIKLKKISLNKVQCKPKPRCAAYEYRIQ